MPAINYNFIADQIRWAVTQGIKEAGQQFTYTALDNSIYDPVVGKTTSRKTEHRGRIALTNWRKGPDAKMQRRGTADVLSFDPPLAREPKAGDMAMGLDGQQMIVKAASAQAFSDVVVAWVIEFEGGAAR